MASWEAPQAAGLNGSGSVPLSPLTGVSLLLARVAWTGIVGMSVGVSLAAVPVVASMYRAACDTNPCQFIGQLTPAALAHWQALGLSIDAFVAYRLALLLLTEAVWLGIAVFLFVRRSHDRMALFVSLTLAVQQASIPANLIAGPSGPWQAPAMFINALAWATLMVIWYVFPNGRFVPRWTRWVALAFVVLLAASIVTGITILHGGELPAVLSAWYLPFFAGVILAPLYRYRKVATPKERQQMKWPVFAVGFYLFVFLLLDALLPAALPASHDLVSLLEAIGLFDILFLAIPIAVAFAMLRYRLYDVDVLIRRTLVYAIVSAVLAFFYFGIIVVLQRLFAGVTGQTSPVAIVASTLAIAALFSPLRRRVQEFVDRRFYRRKYDSQRVLVDFGLVARSETDIEALSDALEAALRETMQPARLTISLQSRDRK
jgi:hypothetical protein